MYTQQDNEMVYHAELIQEQDELRNQHIRELEMQRHSSLTARFQRRQRTTQQQQETEQRWQNLQVGPIQCVVQGK